MEDSHSQHSPQLIPALPDELGLECLTRLPYTTHRVASLVCRRWQTLLESSDFYHERRSKGYTHKLACLVQSLPRDETSTRVVDSPKRVESRSFGLTVFDSSESTWRRVDPIPKYPDGLPMFCHVASCEGKLVVLGGWDPKTYEPVSDVFVFDFAKNRWTEAKPMPTKRSFFAVGSCSGRVYVAGGHDESKNALSSAFAYDLSRDEWTELTQMSQDRDECEGTVVDGEFWVVSGYATESQGAFVSSAEVYDIASGKWRLVDGAWVEGECPRGRVGGWKEGEGRFSSWAELDSAIRVGTCGVRLGDWAMVVGSAYQGVTHEFCMVELRKGQNRKLEKISVPAEFCGFVQSSCCVEI